MAAPQSGPPAGMRDLTAEEIAAVDRAVIAGEAMLHCVLAPPGGGINPEHGVNAALSLAARIAARWLLMAPDAARLLEVETWLIEARSQLPSLIEQNLAELRNARNRSDAHEAADARQMGRLQ